MYLAITGSGKARVFQFRIDTRIPGTNRKKTTVVKTLGNYEKMVAEDPDIEAKLRAQAKAITQQARDENAPIITEIENQLLDSPDQAAKSYHFGHAPLLTFWKTMGIETCIKNHAGKRNSTAITQAICGLLIHRLCDPRSVLASTKNLQRYAGMQEVGLDVHYQALEVLAAWKALLISMLMLLAEETCKTGEEDKYNMYSVYNFFLEKGSSNRQVGQMVCNELDQIMTNLPTAHPAKLAYASSKFAQGDMRSSIFSTLAGNLQLFSDTGIASMTAANEIDIRKIINQPTAIFMIIPDEKVNRYPLASLFVNQAYSTLVTLAMEQAGQTLPRRVQMMLNEFGNMVTIPNMATKMTVSLGRNILFNLFVQSITQIEEKYSKPEANTMIGNCGNQIYINSMDMETNRLYSEMLATSTVNIKELNIDAAKVIQDSIRESAQGKKLMTADELTRMPYGQVVVIRQRSYPIKSKLVPYSLLYKKRKPVLQK